MTDGETKPKARVFVVQQPAFYDREDKVFKPKYDLTPAAEHGVLTFMLGPGNIFKDRMAQALRQMTSALSDFNEDDYLLAVGDPVAIAAAVVIASQKTKGTLKILKWDRILSRYEPFTVAPFRKA